MRRLFAAVILSVCAAATTGIALATPSDDIANAFKNLAQASSYHMNVQTSQGQKMDIDMVPPNKMHMMMGPMEMIRLASATYMKVNGNWMKMPGAMPQMTQQGAAMTYVQTLGSHPNDAKVDDLGMQSVDGVSVHAYKVTPNSGQPATVYVDGSGRPARIDVTEKNGTSVVRFSNYNATLDIQAPI